ncbi:galactan endo-1,6-beta-galactosidase [Paenibacillus taihuensis]|uniref:Galactan endo-1,6-beta-galactosidase n=1 Tax=Paenibacillus taihuensis TaxID=1156355 RepID=A0A3D9SFY1_9BACL|nr:RICIN domain-containing protein [Paenibacillus taihuensis]REE89063.1 galactan endo-1,6-beta-galactosidase [Paenibacillus taihuensis]
MSCMLLIFSFGLPGSKWQPAKEASAASYTAVVNPSVQYQTWEGWGTSLAWWANVIGGAPDSVRNDYANKLFSASGGLGMNIVRYNIGGGENPAYPNNMEYRARVPGYKASAAASYDWNSDANQRWILNAAKSRIASSEFIAEAFANSPPWWMTKSGSVTGGVNAAENLKDDMYDDFADYLTAVVKQFHDNWGIDFRTLSPVNEPSSDYWYYGNRQEGNRMYPANQQVMIGYLYDSLASKGLSTGISGPEETSIDLARDTINSFSAATRAKMVQFNSHTYGGSDRVGLNTAAGGKRIWNSEHGDGDSTGLTMSRNILWDIKYMKNSAWVYWQVVETAGSGWGMLETDLNNPSGDRSVYSVTRKYYTMGQWSKYIRPGYKMLDINNGDSIAAYDSVGKKLIIVGMNDSASSNTITYDLSQFATVSGTLTGTRTSSTENNAALSGLTLSNKQFSVTLPAGSVSTFVITGVDGISSGIDTTGYYKLVNRNSGKLMDVSQGSTSDGADVIQWTDNSGYNQQWQFVSTGSGYYKLVNRNSGKVLDVSGQSTADGGNVIQYTDNGGTNQQWLPVQSGGYYKFVNRNSGKVMDVSGQSTSDGGDVIQYTDTGGNNQQWQLVKVN